MEPRQKPGRSKQDYGTPPEFLAAVKARLGIDQFDWDLAATYDNAVAPSFFSAFDNALEQPWPMAGWNWLNPPYASIGPWVEKARREARDRDVRTVVLIPAAVGSNWWRDYVHMRCRVVFLNPRLTFVGCKDPYPKDCALLLYAHGYRGYEVWTWKTARAKKVA